MIGNLPRAAVPLMRFAELLRRKRYAVSPTQTTCFLAAVRLLGPSSMVAIRHAAYACFAPPADRHGEFEALFRAHFHGELDLISAASPGQLEEVQVRDDLEHHKGKVCELKEGESGQAACAEEQLFARTFTTGGPDDPWRTLQGLASRLPLRRGFRMTRASRGRAIHISRSLARMVRNDGDLPRPAFRKRATRQRSVLLLIDISGSMKAHTADHLRLAHILCRTLERVEIFTLGTRLTRITGPLKFPDEDVALKRTAALVADWDGGTCLGPTLRAFLTVPRFVNYARGAVVLIISDALERGHPAELCQAVCRLQRLAWRLSLASPLLSDPKFRPETEALCRILPHLNDLVDGSSVAKLGSFLQRIALPAPTAAAIWSRGAPNS
jgi:uncharacterized protein with von Willebrand factor type A (vWA) domain